MLFNEAMELLKAGKNVSRASWTEEEGYLVLLTGMKHVWKIITKPAPNAGNHIFSVEELCADNWIEYSVERFAPPATEPVADAA